VIQTLDKVRPDEVYNLARQKSVGLAVDQPIEALERRTAAPLTCMKVCATLSWTRASTLPRLPSSEC
jgi:GDP-D-mannose dehydratase